MKRRTRIRLLNFLFVPLWLIAATAAALWSALDELFKRTDGVN